MHLNVILDSLVFAIAGRTGNRSGIYRYSTELIRALATNERVNLSLLCPDLCQAPWASLETLLLSKSLDRNIQSWKEYFKKTSRIGNSQILSSSTQSKAQWLPNLSYKPQARQIAEITNRLSAQWFHFLSDCHRAHIVHAPFHLLSKPLELDKRHCIIRTIHDVLPITMPEFFVDKSVKRFHAALASIRKDEHILCISHTTKNELLRCQPSIREDQITVTPLAGQIKHKYKEDASDWGLFLHKYGISNDEKLILTVGTIEPRKNVVGLVAALEYLSRSAPCIRLRLLVVGRLGWNYESILDRINQSPCRDKIIFLGDISDSLISCLYDKVDLCAFVSWGEGFGLPVLEAMHAGAPVLASDIESFQEIAGSHAVYVDPSSIADIGEGIRTSLEDVNLRYNLRLHGKKRASRFSWQATATETVRAYHTALGY